MPFEDHLSNYSPNSERFLAIFYLISFPQCVDILLLRNPQPPEPSNDLFPEHEE